MINRGAKLVSHLAVLIAVLFTLTACGGGGGGGTFYDEDGSSSTSSSSSGSSGSSGIGSGFSINNCSSPCLMPRAWPLIR